MNIHGAVTFQGSPPLQEISCFHREYQAYLKPAQKYQHPPVTGKSPSGSLLGTSLPSFGTICDLSRTVTQFTHSGCPTTSYCNHRGGKFPFWKGKRRQTSIRRVNVGSHEARIGAYRQGDTSGEQQYPREDEERGKTACQKIGAKERSRTTQKLAALSTQP